MTDGEPTNSEPEQKKRSINTIGDFELKKRLGKGGMGEVFLARQISLDRIVALKTLSRDLAKKPDFVSRFNREFQSMARLDHANMVKVYAVDESKGIHFAAIEFIDGSSVQAWLDKLKKFPVGDAVHIAMISADALKHAHDLNMVHRDIKPDNILLTSKGSVKVADFGLAKLIDEDVSMTQTGTGLGTPLYMAPEQARSAKTVDQRSDIYSLGATLYHMLTGVPPMQGESALELILAKESGKYEPAKKLRPEIPERLSLIIDKMLAKESKHRYAACDEVVKDLASLGIHSEALSFIDGSQPVALGKSANSTTSGINNTVPRPMVMPRTDVSSRDDARAQELSKYVAEPETKEKKTSRTWYVQYQDRDDNTVVEKLSTGRILKMIKSERITAKGRAKVSADGTYLPLAEFPEFKGAIEDQLAYKSSRLKEDDMKNLYKQVSREERKRSQGRWITDRLGSVMGILSLVAWTAVIAVLAYFVFMGLRMGWNWAAEWVTKLME
ncbi:MAG: serine/threonine-protein kinase [Planctomycetaceae bacterium]